MTDAALKFSSLPEKCIRLAALPATRFIDSDARQLPYRDDSGAININLLRSSIAAIREDSVAWKLGHADKLDKWLKHAVRWELAHADAEAKWSQIEQDGATLWVCAATGERRREVNNSPAADEEATANAGPKIQSRTALKRPCSDAAQPLAKRGVADKVSARPSGRGSVTQVRQAAPAKSRASSGGTVRLVVKGRTAVDASCSIAADCHVLDRGGDAVFDVLLNQTDIANNHNKYYIIQLLETDAKPHRYYAWNRWGRVGEERGYQNALRGPMTVDQAISLSLPYCNTIARPLRNIHPPTDPPPFMPYTIP